MAPLKSHLGTYFLSWEGKALCVDVNQGEQHGLPRATYKELWRYRPLGSLLPVLRYGLEQAQEPVSIAKGLSLEVLV